MRVLTSLVFLAPLVAATPPNIPSAKTAQNELSQLLVAVQGLQDGYSRDKFPHWITQSGACNTREVVLKRDGTGVVTNSACAAVSGVWFSPYDGATWMNASDVDIDHVVPLSNAWKVRVYMFELIFACANWRFQSGASSWTTSRRQAFANDLTNPQLITVTDNVNQAKGDDGPEDWMPSVSKYYVPTLLTQYLHYCLASYHCTYASMWIHVKYNYNLTIDTREKSALQTMLNTCGTLTATSMSNSTSNSTQLSAASSLSKPYDGGIPGTLFLILAFGWPAILMTSYSL